MINHPRIERLVLILGPSLGSSTTLPWTFPAPTICLRVIFVFSCISLQELFDLWQDGNISLVLMRNGSPTPPLCKFRPSWEYLYEALLSSLRCIPANARNGTEEEEGSLAFVVLT